MRVRASSHTPRRRSPDTSAGAYDAGMASRLVLLVPGFFGFSSVRQVSYFERVAQTLGAALRRHGTPARIVRCRTQPTASIARRAEALRRQVVVHGGLRADELHFVGHSTGGLDIRLLLSPGARPDAGGARGAAVSASLDAIARRTRNAISVATPHNGTPLAGDFLTLQGQTLLLVASGLATTAPGRGAVVTIARALALVARLDDWLGREQGPLDRIAAALLRRIQRNRDDPLWQYLGEIQRDQGALLQLTPEGMSLFAAAVADRPGIAYGCVLTGVSPPPARGGATGLLDPETVPLRTLFRLLHAMTARPHPRYPYPPVAPALRERIGKAVGCALEATTNDGIVPTASQLHGPVLHIARADHLDIVGHYTLAGGRTADWLPSGAGFTTKDFEAAWNAVAAAIAGASPTRA